LKHRNFIRNSLISQEKRRRQENFLHFKGSLKVFAESNYLSMCAVPFVMQDLITAGDRDIIIEGLEEIERLIQEGKFEWRKDREDVHMNIEAALIERVGEPAKKLHTARSRNDQIVTDLRLWCRDSIDKILIRIKQLQVCS
jgi:argininosuccinate lyase